MNVHWAITAQPSGGDGAERCGSRDTVFSASVAGDIREATSAGDPTKLQRNHVCDGHPMPYRVTPNGTEPVDLLRDPAMSGSVYEVGRRRLIRRCEHSFPTIAPGSTVRLHNEDTTGVNRRRFEYVQIRRRQQQRSRCGCAGFRMRRKSSHHRWKTTRLGARIRASMRRDMLCCRCTIGYWTYYRTFLRRRTSQWKAFTFATRLPVQLRESNGTRGSVGQRMACVRSTKGTTCVSSGTTTKLR